MFVAAPNGREGLPCLQDREGKAAVSLCSKYRLSSMIMAPIISSRITFQRKGGVSEKKGGVLGRGRPGSKERAPHENAWAGPKRRCNSV